MKVWRAREGEGKEDEEDLLPCLPFDFYQTIKQQVDKVFLYIYIRNENRAWALRLAF